MRILVVTNLYPPQNLGGYGRCLQDFTLSLFERGHRLFVVCADAPYLHENPSQKSLCDSPICPLPVSRTLQLKGTYENGISLVTDNRICSAIDDHNVKVLSDLIDSEDWDLALVGNLDMLGPYLVNFLTYRKLPVFHHHGFINPPFPASCLQHPHLYSALPASFAVRESLLNSGFFIPNTNVVYPGARTSTFSNSPQQLSPSLLYGVHLNQQGIRLGSIDNPLKIGFAGLIMSSKGLHTIVDSLIHLIREGYYFQLHIAGSVYQADYYEKILSILSTYTTHIYFHFYGQLPSSGLVRFWQLCQIGIFPSIHPEAFGIVAAEIMASGVVLISSGVGGSSELFDDKQTGYAFHPDSPASLTDTIKFCLNNTNNLLHIASKAKKHVIERFDVSRSVDNLEVIFSSALH